MIRHWLNALSWAAISLLAIVATTITVGLLLGYRPVALTTGSMSPWAPSGAVVVASPQPRESIGVGDVLIMEWDNNTRVTHRVIELRDIGGRVEVITQGDANPDPDLEPYVLKDQELVGSFAIRGVGQALAAFNLRIAALLIAVGSIATLALSGLRVIWSDPEDETDDDHDDPSPPSDDAPPPITSESGGARVSTGPSPPPPKRRTRQPQLIKQRASQALRGALASLLFTVFVADMALAVFVSSATITDNTFVSSPCFPDVTVQSGSTTSSNASQVVTITAVDPTASFLLFSVSSDSSDPYDSMVLGELTSATTIAFARSIAGGGKSNKIKIEWSVVEYSCGVSVQRGLNVGTGGTVMDVPITSTTASQSFALLSSLPPTIDATYDSNDLVRASVINDTTLRMRAGNFDPATTYGWQVITFDEPGRALTQNLATTLPDGTSTQTLTLGTAVDTTRTIVIAGASTTQAGSDIGERSIRVELTSPTTVQVTRDVSTEPIDVGIQVVQLNDGTRVQRGTAAFAKKDKSVDVNISTVNQTMSTAMSTVNTPGSMSGGSSVHTADDLVGEASATFELRSPTQIRIKRDSKVDAATFIWQVVHWSGR